MRLLLSQLETQLRLARPKFRTSGAYSSILCLGDAITGDFGPAIGVHRPGTLRPARVRNNKGILVRWGVRLRHCLDTRRTRLQPDRCIWVF